MADPPQMLFIYADAGGASCHLGASYIQAYLKRRGMSSRQFIHPARINLDGLVERIVAVGAGVIGFTCYDKNYYISKLIAQRLKHRLPELLIIFGGPTPTFLDRLIMRDCPAIDICVRGEGEYTLGELLQQLPDKNGFGNISGITFRQGKQLVRTPQRLPDSGLNRAEALDIFPSPYLEGIIPPEFITAVGLSTSRGCPYHCTYCNCSLASGRIIRYHSPRRIIAELKLIEAVLDRQLDRGQKRKLAINDDIFTMDVARVKHICRLIIDQGFEHLELLAETRADKVDEELLQLLYAAGFREINFGLESAVPRVLRTIKKAGGQSDNLQPERDFINRLKRSVRQAQRIGLNPTVSIISGLPGETLPEAEQTIRLVRELKVSSYFHNTLHVYAGSELFRTHPRHGIRLRLSATTLPFNLRPAYDVNRVPVVDGPDTCFKYGVLMEEAKAQQVLRLWGIDPVHQVWLKDILIEGHSVLDTKIIDWLTKYAHLSTRLCVWSRRDENFDYRRSINRMAACRAPIPDIDGLVQSSVPRSLSQMVHLRRYVWNSGLSSDGFYPPHLHSFYFIPLGDFDRLWEEGLRPPAAKGVFLFSLDKPADIAGFRRLICRFQTGLTGIPPALVDYHSGIIDECRWGAGECPAPRLLKLVVQGQEIKPCVNGRVIGGVGDEISLIGNRLTVMKEKVEQRRGCNRCAVRDNCSRCPFPYPLSEADYCDFRREYPRLGEVIRFLAYLRRAFLYRRLPRDVFADLFSHPSPEAIAELTRFIKAYELYRQANPPRRSGQRGE
jgi:radical SAM superfamily enzyme YgiQ (UPF0313 family)